MLILQILKVIGIIILSLLGLILLILAYFTLFPILFNIDADFDGKDYSIKVNDILKFYYIEYKNSKGISNLEVSFLFKLIRLNNKKSCKKKVKEKDQKNTKQDDKSKKAKKNDDKKSSKEKIIALLRDESAFPVFKAIVFEFVRILKKLSPKKIIADLDYGAGSPDYTGYITGLLSVIPWSYEKTVSLRPDFLTEKAYIKGHLEFKSRFALVEFVISLVRLLINKDVRKLLFKGNKNFANK